MLDKNALVKELIDFRALLKSHGVERVRVEFHGGGDEGCMETPDLTPEQFKDVRVEWTYNRPSYNSELRQYDMVETRITPTLLELTELVLERQVDQYQVDWYNDSGGYGHCELDVDTGRFDMEINQHYTETKTIVCNSCRLDEEHLDSPAPASESGNGGADV